MKLERSEKFLNSETMVNVANAFAGECQARMRYDFFAKVADKEGHKFIEDIFRETALNEKSHAKIYYNFLVNHIDVGKIRLTGEYPVAFSKTEDNLKISTEGELEEWKKIYPYGAKIAEEEGFHVIADAFKKVGEVEWYHAQRFMKLREQMLSGMLYKSRKKVKWKCRNCGHIHEGYEAPETCPNCRHEQGFYERYFDYFEGSL